MTNKWTETAVSNRGSRCRSTGQAHHRINFYLATKYVRAAHWVLRGQTCPASVMVVIVPSPVSLRSPLRNAACAALIHAGPGGFTARPYPVPLYNSPQGAC